MGEDAAACATEFFAIHLWTIGKSVWIAVDQKIIPIAATYTPNAPVYTVPMCDACVSACPTSLDRIIGRILFGPACSACYVHDIVHEAGNKPTQRVGLKRQSAFLIFRRIRSRAA